MTRRAAVGTVIALVLAGCSGTEPGTQTPEATATPTPELPPSPTPTPSATPTPTQAPTPTLEPTPDPRFCNPALVLSPDAATVAPLALLTFKASGGTGEYRFEVLQNESGGVLNTLTGAYLAGPTAETTDIIQLIDLGCEGEATATVTIPKALDVAPLSAEVDRGVSFLFEITGGSGDFRCNLLTNGSGGTLDTYGCEYTAGTKDGVDVARVVDVATGQFQDSYITVKAGAVLKPVPATIFMPEGARFALNIRGGSGSFDVLSDSNSVAYEGGELFAEASGNAEITATDRFTRQVTQLQVKVVAPQQVSSLVRTGEKSNTGTVYSPGDLDGDGLRDVLLALPEVDGEATNGGAVYLYRGRDGGMDPAPAQVLAGTAWDEWFGSDLSLGDVTGDGIADMVVGAYKANGNGDDRGAVYLHEGLVDGTFAPASSWMAGGISDQDLLGRNVVTCDFNGDGRIDVAASADADEDNSKNPVPSDQGSVHIFLNSNDGLPTKASQVVYGGYFSEGQWKDNAGKRYGLALGAGDVNGDGACDLVVGTYGYDSDPAVNTDDGAVFVHAGVVGSSSAVTRVPIIAWTPEAEASNGSQLGRVLVVDDANEDGFDDILVGQPRHRPQPANSSANGGIRLYLGQAWTLDPATDFTPAEDSDWLAEGDNKDDYFGFAVRIDDASGDGYPDMIAGNIDDEAINRTATSGTVTWYQGVPGGVPSSTATKTLSGLYGNERFGQAMGVIDDHDGDGLPDFFVFASRGDTLGWEVGTPYYVLTRFEGAMEALDMPGIPAGELLSPVAFVGDFNADGRPDLVAGAPAADVTNTVFNGGAVWYYPGEPGGVSDVSSKMLAGQSGYSENDGMGYSVTGIGDFNKDGRDDFAVLARLESKPSTFSTSDFANPTECAGAKAEVGAVYIYLGRADGIPQTRPSFVWYGPQEKNSLLTLAGGFDYDGDGFDDLFAGAYPWNRDTISDSGGFALVRGRAASSDTLTTVICAADYTLLGANKDDRLGTAGAALGDLDKDGCDELAIGASHEDYGIGDQGSVRILYGFGSKCAHSSATGTVFTSGNGSAQAGTSLGSGGDVDGDGLWDLAIGGPNLTINGSAVGGAWLLQASRILSLPTVSFVDGQVPSQSHSIGGAEGVFRVEGARIGEQCGRAVGIVRGLGDNGLDALAVGCPLGDTPGIAQAGGVRIYRFRTVEGDEYGIDLDPVAAFGGETDPALGYLGDSLATTRLDGGYLAVGGQRGDGAGTDTGVIYVVRLGD